MVVIVVVLEENLQGISGFLPSVKIIFPLHLFSRMQLLVVRIKKVKFEVKQNVVFASQFCLAVFCCCCQEISQHYSSL